MTRKEWKKVLPIVQAFTEGKTIQIRLTKNLWADCNDLDFDLSSVDEYRIKPETRPFKNIDEMTRTWKEIYPSQPICIKPLIWIENRFTEEVELIIGFNYANGFHDDDRVKTVSRELTMDDLYREYKFLSGDICGVKE
jgi:hypothetical protein